MELETVTPRQWIVVGSSGALRHCPGKYVVSIRDVVRHGYTFDPANSLLTVSATIEGRWRSDPEVR